MASQAHVPAAESDPQTRLCEDFAQALHAIAQPLTVLRGTLGALTMREASGPDVGKYLEMSHAQVDRLCSLVSGMQCLLEQLQRAPVCIPVNLCLVVASILGDENFGLRRSGLRLSAAKLDGDLQVLADRGRMEHAIQAVLRAIAGISSDGGEISVEIDRRDGFADVIVRASDTDAKRLSSIERLHLSLAETSIRSQQGLFEYRPEPLRITLKLPLYDQSNSDRLETMQFKH